MEIKLKSAWDKLSMLEKALLIKLSVDNGVSSLKLIRDTYNLYSDGGQKEVLNKVNSSNTNFVQRLKDPNRKNIPDWESPTDRISTHKLSVGTDENGNHYIFPEVQEINGELIDFTRPPYHRFAGEISAEMRGDTVRVPSIEDGIKFTLTYKQYYPFNNGGDLTHKYDGELVELSLELTSLAKPTAQLMTISGFESPLAASKINLDVIQDYITRFTLEHPNINLVDLLASLLNVPLYEGSLGNGTVAAWMSGKLDLRGNFTHGVAFDEYLSNDREINAGNTSLFIKAPKNALEHELLGHGARDIALGSTRGSTDREKEVIGNAYPFLLRNVYSHYNLNKAQHLLAELLATNTQLRAMLQQNTGLYGEAFDKYVDSMSYEDLYNALYTLNSGYYSNSDLSKFFDYNVEYTKDEQNQINELQVLLLKIRDEREKLAYDIYEERQSENVRKILGDKYDSYFKDREKRKLNYDAQELEVQDLLYKLKENSGIKNYKNANQIEAIKNALKTVAYNNINPFEVSNNTHLAAFGGPLTHKKSGKEYGESSWLNNGYKSSNDWLLLMKMNTNQMLQNLLNSPFYMTNLEMLNLEFARMQEAIGNNSSSESITYTGFDNNGNEITKRLPVAKGLNTMMDAGVVDYMPMLGDAKLAAEAVAAATQGDYLTAGLLGGMMFIPNIIEKPLKSLKTYVKNATNRALESALRIGDVFADNPFTFARLMLGNKGSGLRYVLTGLPQLAYLMPYRYSGQVLWSPDNTVAESAHIGDLIDVIMGKSNVLLDEYGNTLGRLTDDITNIPDKTIAAFQSLPGRSDVLPKVLKFDLPTLFPEFIPKQDIQLLINTPLNIPMEIGRRTKPRVPILLGGRTVSIVDPGHYGLTALKTDNGLQLFGHDVYHYTPKNAKQANFSTSWMPNIPITIGNPFVVEWQVPELIYDASRSNSLSLLLLLPYSNVKPSNVKHLFNIKEFVANKTSKLSTGGPLYPFSFEKNPFFKTPVVRYDEGGDMSNNGGYTDEQLSKNQYVWNRFDPTGRFYIDNAILSAKYGNLARGEENEYWKAYLGLDNSVPMMRAGANTEWDQLIENEKILKNEPISDFYGTTPRMDYNIQALADTLFLGDMYRNYNVYSQEYKDLPSLESIGTLYEQAKTVLNNPNQWVPIDGDDITLKYYNDFDETSELNPLGMLAHFGLKWVPELKSLFMHDTYDFPNWVTWLSSIPDRPKEMKIRSKINFDPNKGSWLLRNATNYNTETPAIKSVNK